MITTHAKKQGSKKTNSRNRLYNTKTCTCIAVTQGNGKSLMKFATVPAKTLKIVKCLAKILLNIDIMHLCLLPCFRILFKIQLKRVTKMS